MSALPRVCASALAAAVPADLVGTLFRAGPGLFARGGDRVAHPFDGDGRVDRVTFARGRATCVSRFVETPAFLAEARAGRLLHRGAFGTAPRAPPWSLKNAANTAALFHAGTLLALWEGGAASALCPRSLAYLGPHALGGAARTRPPWLGGDAVAAHARRCARTGRLVMLLTRFSFGNTELRFVEFERDSWAVAAEARHEVAGFAAVHDFALTPTRVVFFVAALAVDARALAAGAGALAGVRHARAPTRLVAAPRGNHAGKFVEREVPRAFVTHVINARDAPCGGVDVDFFAMPELSGGAGALETGAWRARAGGGVERADRLLGEFPALNPAALGGAHAYHYYAGCSRRGRAMDAWIKADAAAGGRRVAAACTPGALHLEPVFAARAGAPRGAAEDDGYLIGFVLVGGEPFLKVVDAASMRQVALAPAPAANPTGLHACWVPGANFEDS